MTTGVYKVAYRKDEGEWKRTPQGHNGWPHDVAAQTADRFKQDGYQALIVEMGTECNTIGSGDFSLGSKVWPGTSKLLEEMGELQQVLGKLIAVAGSNEHWDGDLRPRLIDECADVAAALQVFTVENFTREELLQMLTRSEEKKALFRKWHAENTRPSDDLPLRCVRVSPKGNQCEKAQGHFGSCHANDGRYVEDWG